MNKKNYQKPVMQVVSIKMRYQFAEVSPGAVSTVSSNGIFSDAAPQGGDGTGVSAPRSRGYNEWDDEE